MTQTADTLSKQAVQLPPAERMALVEQILDSLDVPDPTLDALWAKEADDRLAAYRRGEISAMPLSEVLAKYQSNPKSDHPGNNHMAQTAKNGELLLMPTPKALEKALVQSAQNAQRLAKAFGVKVPMVPRKSSVHQAG